MFGISFGELFVIGLVALVVIGPEKLPALARTLGKFVRQVQGYTNAFKAELNRELHNAEILELEKELAAEGKKLHTEFTQSINPVLQETTAELAKNTEAIREEWHTGSQLQSEATPEAAIQDITSTFSEETHTASPETSPSKA